MWGRHANSIPFFSVSLIPLNCPGPFWKTITGRDK